MRFPATAVVILYFCVSPLSAQSSRPPVPVPAASLPPMQLEGQWTTALINRDARTFERLLAPGFVYTEDATVMGRNDWIRSGSGPDPVEWAANEGMGLHDFGDVQVITGVLHLRGRGKQSPFDRRYPFTGRCQRAKQRYHIIAAQDYLIPK